MRGKLYDYCIEGINIVRIVLNLLVYIFIRNFRNDCFYNVNVEFVFIKEVGEFYFNCLCNF